uniref:HAT C-terminal dimerisation domain-containing protein n=1 Tax=Romanomermis culicivorax TaxID=13658 RepID=A0A915L989_ROMCU
MWKDQFKTKSTDLPDNALDALNMHDSQFEANINTALKILAIVPVITSSSERLYSKLYNHKWHQMYGGKL